ncbi:MAG: META domain-containing protein, partial [Anaerolineae bacterium]|nr:META domain-containing protein [Anaerolineae bacterium]
VFAAQPELAGTRWALVALDGTAVAADPSVTLAFGMSGEAHGSTGCNSFRTTYRVEGDTIAFDERIITTRRACLSAEANAQEQAVLAALAGAATYEREGDRLTITSGEGGQLDFVLAAE